MQTWLCCLNLGLQVTTRKGRSLWAALWSFRHAERIPSKAESPGATWFVAVVDAILTCTLVDQEIARVERPLMPNFAHQQFGAEHVS
jgi:hypothetical protein